MRSSERRERDHVVGLRASSVHDTKAEAEAAGREMANETATPST
ncbi:DUF2188 domain-containing protein [Micromonospora chersina]